MNAPRRSPRIAAKMTAAPVVAPVAAPVAAPVRRSMRLAILSEVNSMKTDPSHWYTHTSYKGLPRTTCLWMDGVMAQVREYLGAIEMATNAVDKATLMIWMFQYLYTYDLLVLRSPRFRAVAMEKLEGILNSGSTMAKITATQSRKLRAQHKLWKNKYKEMETDPLYVA